MRTRLVFLVTIALVIGALRAEADAQPRLRFEIAPGGALLVDNPPDLDFGLGFGAEASLMYRFGPQWMAYVGVDWHRFIDGTSASIADVDLDLEETGYGFGLRFEPPIGVAGSPAIMLRIGGTWNRLDFLDAESDTRDSGRGLGWEVGGGVAFPVSQRWTLTPAVRYRATNRDFEVGDLVTPATVGYAVAELGIGMNF